MTDPSSHGRLVNGPDRVPMCLCGAEGELSDADDFYRCPDSGVALESLALTRGANSVRKERLASEKVPGRAIDAAFGAWRNERRCWDRNDRDEP